MTKITPVEKLGLYFLVINLIPFIFLGLLNFLYKSNNNSVNKNGVAISLGTDYQAARELKPYSHKMNRAFDESVGVNDFWETKNIPVTVIWKFPFPMTIQNYFISSGELSSRMPSSWEIFGRLQDGKEILLDKVVKGKRWLPFETYKQIFELKSSFLEARLNINASEEGNILRIYEIGLTPSP